MRARRVRGDRAVVDDPAAARRLRASSAGTPPACRGTRRSGSCRRPRATARRSRSSSGTAGAPMPALLNSRSSRPKRSVDLGEERVDRRRDRVTSAGDGDRAVAGRRARRPRAARGGGRRATTAKPVAGERDGDRAADAAAGAGDERDPRHGRAAHGRLCVTSSTSRSYGRPRLGRHNLAAASRETNCESPGEEGVPGLSPVCGDGSSSSCPSLDPISLLLPASWTRELRAS